MTVDSLFKADFSFKGIRSLRGICPLRRFSAQCANAARNLRQYRPIGVLRRTTYT